MPYQASRTAAATHLIEHFMKALLGHALGATRVRLALIPDGIADITMADRRHYDVTDSVAVRSRLIGITLQNQPLVEWSAFLPALLAGRCTMQRISRTGVAALWSRKPSSRLIHTLVCPVICAAEPMAGALFVLWDATDPQTTEQGLHDLAAIAARVAGQIAEVLDLAGHKSLHIKRDMADLQPGSV